MAMGDDSTGGEGGSGRPPYVAFVTGPRGAGKTGWIQRRIQDRRRQSPAARFGVLLAEDGRTRMEPFVRSEPGVYGRRVVLPCVCCPGLVDLPREVRELAALRIDALYLEVPAAAATGLVADFDRVLGWPRDVIVLLDRAWAEARRAGTLTPFHAAVLDLATAGPEGA